ncbi:hypothetical protein Q7P37_008891 [Cladosporium fusiforme]
MVIQPPDGPPEDTSDLAALWNEALLQFKSRTGRDLGAFQFKSMQEAIDATKSQADSFGAFRHDQGKVDKVRTAFGNNLKSIERIVSGAKMAADTAAVFPPAIPGAALMTAFTFVFQTFKDVKHDYDRVAGFFSEMESFLDRISMLETKSPKLGPFERCVRKVFAGMLTLCGVAADYKGKGRFRKWVRNVVDGGQDPELAGAYSTVEDAIDKLGMAVGVATLRTVVEIKETTTRLDDKTDNLLNDTSVIREGVESLSIGVDGVNTSIMHVDSTIVHVRATMERQHAALISKLDSLLLETPSSRPSGEKKKPEPRKGDPSGKKMRALAQVRRHFADGAATRKKIASQCKDIDDSRIEGTSTWVFDHEKYKRWASGAERILWLSGDAGAGKTYLARAIALDVSKTKASDKASIAQFYFQEGTSDLRSFRNALRCSVLEIAEKNIAYCEVIAGQIASDANEEPWKQFFANRFPSGSEAHLYLIIDGVDEAFDTDVAVMAEVLKEVSQQSLNIHILFTGRPKLRSALGELQPLELEITKDLIAEDMRKLVHERIKSLPRLHKFHRRTRRRIETRVMEGADGMLYVEHMLRRLSAIGRESTVLKDIEASVPDSLEALYGVMLAECQKGRTDDHYNTLKTMFAALAFSKRDLTLDEAKDLVHLVDPDGAFDIEDEIVGRSARILELAREWDESEAADEEDCNSNAEDDDLTGTEDLDQSGRTPLSFQERSMREYFRSINVGEDGLRTSPSRAHLAIFQLLVQLLCDTPADANGERGIKLQDYASHYWLHHFCEISIDTITDEEFNRALAGFHRIVSNVGGVTLAFETWNASDYVALGKELRFHDKLQSWFRKAGEVSSLDAVVKDWASSHVEEPNKAFLSLGRAHVEDLFKTSTEKAALSCFNFAKSALLVAGVDIDEGSAGDKDIIQTLDNFDDVKPTASGYRAIAYITQAREEYEKSTSFCLEGLQLATSEDVGLRCELLMITARSKERVAIALNRKDEAEGDDEEGKEQHGTPAQEDCDAGADGEEGIGNRDPMDEGGDRNDDETDGENDDDPNAFSPGPGNHLLQEALSITDEAIALLPKDFANDEKLAHLAEQIFLLRASCQKHTGRYEEAFQSYDEHRAVRPGVDTLTGRDMEAIFRVKDWSKEPQGALNLIASWTVAERMRFFEDMFDWEYYENGDSIDDLERYAKTVGKDGIDQVLEWWERYIETISKGSSKIIGPKIELAAYYRSFKNDRQTAMRLYNEILEADFKVDDYGYTEQDLLYCRLNLADTIFTCFRASTSPSEKSSLLDKMRNLPNLKTSSDQDAWGNLDNWNASQTQVMLALMTRTIGSSIEYYRLMDTTFKTSVIGLTDSVGWNDSDSFRLLAKVLACVPGLERDAQIALSCQFSITDVSVDHGDGDTDGSSAEYADLEQNKALRRPGNNEDTDTQCEPTAHDEQLVTKLTTVTIDQKPGATEPNIIAEVKVTDPTTASSGENQGDEDMLPKDSRYTECDGCGKEYTDWKGSGAVYFCVQCANCDLCENCYKVRKDADRTGIFDHWYEYCGQQHTHIKAPVTGWNGVKNGTLRIGDEHIPFKDWLAGLRDERWPRAWDEFWKNEPFLRNIGF